MTRPALHVVGVDADTGEVVEAPACPGCAQLEDEIAGLERVIRSQGASMKRLERNAEQAARSHPLWDEAEAIFDHWRRACRHPRSVFDAQRFELVLPYLQKHGADLCRRAIDGAAFDPYVTTRKNGSQKRHDDWGLIYRDADKFEDMANRAPRETA